MGLAGGDVSEATIKAIAPWFGGAVKAPEVLLINGPSLVQPVEGRLFS